MKGFEMWLYIRGFLYAEKHGAFTRKMSRHNVVSVYKFKYCDMDVLVSCAGKETYR